MVNVVNGTGRPRAALMVVSLAAATLFGSVGVGGPFAEGTIGGLSLTDSLRGSNSILGPRALESSPANPFEGLFIKSPFSAHQDEAFYTPTGSGLATFRKAEITLSLTSRAAAMFLPEVAPRQVGSSTPPGEARTPDLGGLLRLTFPGAREIAPIGIVPASSSLGRAVAGSSSIDKLEAFTEIRYVGLFPSVDLAIESHVGGIKYRVITSNLAALDKWIVGFGNSTQVSLDLDGSLSMVTGGAVFHDEAPFGIQAGKEIGCEFRLLGSSKAGLQCHGDPNAGEISVDPLITSERFGGSDGDLAFAARATGDGSVLVSGYSYSLDFPTTAPSVQPKFGGQIDAFVAKMGSGGEWIWATLLGGEADDAGVAVDISSSGRVFVAGYTESKQFPTPHPLTDPSYNGTPGRGDAFVSGLSADGQLLLFTTFLGAEYLDEAKAISVNDAGVYVCGRTTSPKFPTTGDAAEQSYGGGKADAFVARLSADGSIEKSTFLGGAGVDSCNTLDASDGRTVLVAGSTDSSDFPGGLVGGTGPPVGGSDAFYGEYDENLTGLVFREIIGGQSDDEFTAISRGTAGVAHVVGNIATAVTCGGVASPTSFHGGSSDIASVTFDASNGQALRCASYGGSGEDRASSLVASDPGTLIAAGFTSSDDFVQTSGSPFFGYQGGAYDGIVLRLDPKSLNVTFSTFLGGTGGDYARAVSPLGQDRVLVFGNTNSTDFPSLNQGYAASPLGGRSDAFFVALRLLPDPPALTLSVTPSAVNISAGGSAALEVAVGSFNGYDHWEANVGAEPSPFRLDGACLHSRIAIPGNCRVSVQAPDSIAPGTYLVTFFAGNETVSVTAQGQIRIEGPAPGLLGENLPLLFTAIVAIAVGVLGLRLWFKRRSNRDRGPPTGAQRKSR